MGGPSNDGCAVLRTHAGKQLRSAVTIDDRIEDPVDPLAGGRFASESAKIGVACDDPLGTTADRRIESRVYAASARRMALQWNIVVKLH